MTELKAKIGWNLDNSYSRLPDVFFTSTNPTPVSSPKLVILNEPLATSLGLDPQELKNNDGTAIFSGNKLAEGSKPIAQAYAGHQFGHFTMLGDGRAILLGEQVNSIGERVDIQLKGPGRTRYSRGGDGRASLGPMLREYIISEAMHGLGIPTTRSLAVTTTGESVVRETKLPGAILTRVASSHIRVGTFQFAANYCNVEELRALADYTINRHFPQSVSDENPYLSLLQEVIKGQAELIAKWQLVGFIHGVMNTDNMTISGETIDYGPCAFIDTYNPATVFSSIDVNGRYAYGNQPYIGVWNLARFAETLVPLLHDNKEEAIDLAQQALGDFTELYYNNWLYGMRAKIGIFNKEEEDQFLVEELLSIMKNTNSDYTNTFLALTFDNQSDIELFKSAEFKQWNKKWQDRLGRQEESKDSHHQLMKSSNPAAIPRNHRVEEALEAAVKHGDYSVTDKLVKALATPYAHSKEQAEYAAPPKPSVRCYKTFCGT